MKSRMLGWLVPAAAAWALASGCSDTGLGSGSAEGLGGPRGMAAMGSAQRLPAGTFIDVRVLEDLSSETARSGDAWRGMVARPVIAFGRVILAAGCPVEGVVLAADEGDSQSRGRLQLAIRSIQAGGMAIPMDAVAQPVIAGSTRAGNNGANTGEAAAATSTGRKMGGGVDAAAGAIREEGAAAGAVPSARVQPATLREGTVLTFVESGTIALR